MHGYYQLFAMCRVNGIWNKNGNEKTKKAKVPLSQGCDARTKNGTGGHPYRVTTTYFISNLS